MEEKGDSLLKRDSLTLGKRLLALLVIIGWVLPFYVSATFIFVEFKKALKQDESDRLRRKFSLDTGREIKVASLGIISKMKNYGGWKDEYSYLFFRYPENEPHIKSSVVSSRKLEHTTVYKVLEVIPDHTSSFDACMLINTELETEKILVRCNDLDKIEEITDIYEESLRDIKDKSYTHVAVAYDFPKHLASVASVNNFNIIKINTASELDELLTVPVVLHGREYRDIFLKLPVYIGSKVSLNENFLSYFMVNEPSRKIEYINKIRPFLFNYTIPEDVTSWVETTFDSSQNKWVFYSLAIYLGRYIKGKYFGDAPSAYLAVEGLKELKTCLRPFIKGDKELDVYFRELIQVMFEPKEVAAFERLELLAQSNNEQTYYEKIGCTIYRPPVF